jgi:hypothetical protein
MLCAFGHPDQERPSETSMETKRSTSLTTVPTSTEVPVQATTPVPYFVPRGSLIGEQYQQVLVAAKRPTQTPTTPEVCPLLSAAATGRLLGRRSTSHLASSSDIHKSVVCGDSLSFSCKRILDDMTNKNDLLCKKLKLVQQKSRRLENKVSTLQEVIATLKKERMVSESGAELLQNTISGVPLSILQRTSSNAKSGKLTRQAFPPELRAFALTLNFYSPKAYNYVRKTFQMSLPHPSVIRSWYACIGGEPGFTGEAYNALKMKADETKSAGDPLLCSLMFDEMSIRKHVEWDGKQFRGYVDVGTGLDDDSIPEASEALVFMVVAVKSNWKVPCGYFLINGLSGEERKNLVKDCLCKLHEVGVKIVSLTFDGPSCNLSMAKHLGANLSPPDVKPYFKHPVTGDNVYIFLDACHMLKLMRNALASEDILVDICGNQIKWTYIVKLRSFQDREGLRAGNKLKKAHIEWEKQKMKVSLAAQTLSSSVADALEFCAVDLGMVEFDGCQPTVKFIRIIDRLFDALNSRNPVARNYKAPLKRENQMMWQSFFMEAKDYLVGLKNKHGVPVYKTNRKTPVIGFLTCLQSATGLFDELVMSPSPCMKYLLMYKFSQDHIELFFNAIRGCGGWNNNPTARQFVAAYKRLLVRHEVQASNGNCVAQENITILNVSSKDQDVTPSSVDSFDMSLIRRYDLEIRSPITDEHDYSDVPNMMSLSPYVQNVVGYMSGFVVRSLMKHMNCLECKEALLFGENDDLMSVRKLLDRKNRGGLVIPSHSVVTVCETAERCFKRLLAVNNGKPPANKYIDQAISHVVLNDIGEKNLFQGLQDHMFDSTPDNNHLFRLVKNIAAEYIKIRLYHMGKQYTDLIVGDRVRKQLSKLVLFKNQ